MKVSLFIKILLLGKIVATTPFTDGDFNDCLDLIDDRSLMAGELSKPSVAAQLSNVDADLYDFTFACVEEETAATDARK